MAFFVSGAAVGAIGQVDATALNTLGTVRESSDGNWYIYLRGCASVVDADWVAYDGAYLCTRTVATSAGPCAIATAAVIADTYGWFTLIGSDTASVLSACLSNATLYANAGAGAMAGAVVANKAILNAVPRTAAASNLATVQINRPWIGDNTISA